MELKNYIYVSVLISLSTMYGSMWGPSSMIGTMWPDDYENIRFDALYQFWQQLNNLTGSSSYDKRKEIIQCQIDHWQVDPNTIVYQGKITPLYESVFFEDIPFAKYLLEKGAKPDEKTFKMVEGNAALIALLGAIEFKKTVHSEAK